MGEIHRGNLQQLLCSNNWVLCDFDIETAHTRTRNTWKLEESKTPLHERTNWNLVRWFCHFLNPKPLLKNTQLDQIQGLVLLFFKTV